MLLFLSLLAFVAFIVWAATTGSRLTHMIPFLDLVQGTKIPDLIRLAKMYDHRLTHMPIPFLDLVPQRARG